MLRLSLPERLLALRPYQNQGVVRHHQHKHNQLTMAQCQQLLTDLCAWLALKEWRAEHHRPTYLFGPLLPLDELWHSFILHTQDYHEFCLRYFGYYVHHRVEPFGAEHPLDGDELACFFKDGFTHLGDAWMQRQFGALLTDLV